MSAQTQTLQREGRLKRGGVLFARRKEQRKTGYIYIYIYILYIYTTRQLSALTQTLKREGRTVNPRGEPIHSYSHRPFAPHTFDSHLLCNLILQPPMQIPIHTSIYISYSHLSCTTPIHTAHSHLPFIPPISHSHLPYTPPIHLSFHSHLPCIPPIHTSHSHLPSTPPKSTSHSHLPFTSPHHTSPVDPTPHADFGAATRVWEVVRTVAAPPSIVVKRRVVLRVVVCGVVLVVCLCV